MEGWIGSTSVNFLLEISLKVTHVQHILCDAAYFEFVMLV
jgi:hypothetical protein